MVNRSHIRWVVHASLAIAVIAIGVTISVAADGQPPSRAQLREHLVPVYHQVLADPLFAGLRDRVRASGGDQEAVDRLLHYLPLSPLEMVQIDMEARHYEFAVPAPVNELHQRWIELNPELAREHYGDAYVDHVLGDAGTAPDEEQADGTGIVKSRETTVGPNRNLAADFSETPEEYQGEVQVAVNPNDPSQVVAASNTMHDCGWGPTQGIFYSSDGGDSWGFTCAPAETAYGMTCDSILIPFVFGSDPAVWWNDADEVFVEYMLLCTDAILPLITEFSLVVAKSVNGGSSWSGQGIVVNSWGTSNIEDKNFYAVDRSPTSPYYGRHYTCWDRNNNEKTAYSANGGSSWTEVDLPAVGGTDLGCEMAVQKTGVVHIVFDSLTCAGQNCTDERMYYARSTDGGASWSAPTQLKDFNLVSFSQANCPGAQDNRCINPFGAIDVDNSGGACDGNLYVTFTDWTSGGVEMCDVWLIRSEDGGNSWSAPLRINDDGAGGHIQFHPFLMVDQARGDVIVAWHDARNDANNDAVDYFVARSTDCGQSFEANVQASQPSPEFNNSGISSSNENTTTNPGANPNQYGEYMGLDVLDGVAYIAWADTRHFFPGSTGESQKENVGFVKVTFDAGEDCDLFCDDFESGDTSQWSETIP